MSQPPGDAAGTALVTGAGRRIGAAIARHLAGRSHRLALHYRTSTAGATALRDEIVAAGGKAALFPADLRDPDAVRAAAREMVEKVVWEVVPELAETIIREELQKLWKQQGGA